jgi:hypothetical protein
MRRRACAHETPGLLSAEHPCGALSLGPAERYSAALKGVAALHSTRTPKVTHK